MKFFVSSEYLWNVNFFYFRKHIFFSLPNPNTYIRLNSKLISEITNLENKLKTLNVEQMEVLDYIKNKIDEQILLFLSGEGGCGKTYLLN